MKRSEPVLGRGGKPEVDDELETSFGSIDEMEEMVPEPLELPEERRRSRRIQSKPGPSLGDRLSSLTRKVTGALKRTEPKPRSNHREPPPDRILQLSVVAREGVLSGPMIYQSARELALEYGDMGIFHYREEGRVIFSMANLVNPGVFPEHGIDQFTTPGLLLFARLPGPKDALETFSNMLSTADRLAKRLNGEIQDETHSALSRQTIEHTREELLEYRRRLQLSRGRR